MIRAGCISLLIVMLSGCGIIGQQKYQSASLVDYLYPDKNAPLIEPSIPTLKVPTRVGIAFVPGNRHNGLTEQSKNQILKQVSEHFSEYKFVDRIEEIPSAYIRPGGGFENLDQLRRLFGIDLIALVSYDQHQFTDEGFASLTYWTIVGAYVVPGEKNSTHTLMDTVVYDINSRSLLFRAPGVSQVKSSSTLVNLSEQQRLDSGEGFDIASKDMILSLDKELSEFRERIKQQPEDVKVEYRSGYSGGGSMDLGWIALLLIIGVAGIRAKRSQ
ncbi:rhombotarget lipoprotein [Porticoccaceae bacterium LTM1]|nr:rhombotarget lipoprotein [Porticoccaceae bacterium LTM1]